MDRKHPYKLALRGLNGLYNIVSPNPLPKLILKPARLDGWKEEPVVLRSWERNCPLALYTSLLQKRYCTDGFGLDLDHHSYYFYPTGLMEVGCTGTTTRPQILD